jgi:hypothetical protein
MKVDRIHIGTTTPQKIELAAPRIIKNLPNNPDDFHSAIMMALNL